jgi:Regulator of chromosome condensation (RCC1) repeat
LTNVVAISAGFSHSLALKADGTVIGWGDNDLGETNIPAGLTNVVAIAAGDEFSLALKADGTVVGWGDNYEGEATGVPNTVSPYISSGPVTIAGQPLTNAVAIAAGDGFSLALKADGTVVGWGYNYFGEATGVPNTVSPYISFGTVAIAGQPLTNVVAIAAGAYHGLALKADGTVVGWGDNRDGQIIIPTGLTNAVAIAAGEYTSLFLTATNADGSAASGGLSFVRAELPERLGALFQRCNQNTIDELALSGSDLDNAAEGLSGVKMLLTDVLELGMPYTLAHDGILHGFLYGSDSLMDSDAATTFLQNQNAQLQASPNAAAGPALTIEGALRYVGFQDRLNQDLTNLQATGQPEIPRLVGQTLRLLNLLSDAWTQPTNSPPPALEISSQTNTPSLLLYGEPYMNYTLQYQGSLGAPGWTTTTLTNLQDEETITPPFSGNPQGFYRAMLPTP